MLIAVFMFIKHYKYAQNVIMKPIIMYNLCITINHFKRQRDILTCVMIVKQVLFIFSLRISYIIQCNLVLSTLHSSPPTPLTPPHFPSHPTRLKFWSQKLRKKPVKQLLLNLSKLLQSEHSVTMSTWTRAIHSNSVNIPEDGQVTWWYLNPWLLLCLE